VNVVLLALQWVRLDHLVPQVLLMDNEMEVQLELAHRKGMLHGAVVQQVLDIHKGQEQKVAV